MKTISVIPFDSEVIGADDEFVYIKEIYEDDDGNYPPCVIKVTKEQFMRMISLWIERKAEYYKLWGHFCGVFGNFYSEDYIKEGEISLLVNTNRNKPIYKNVPLYKIISFDENCDMEHG
jgi:hypothetical protein